MLLEDISIKIWIGIFKITSLHEITFVIAWVLNDLQYNPPNRKLYCIFAVYLVVRTTMKKLFLSGTLHPERAMLSVRNLEHEFLGPDGKKQGRIKFNIYNNQITAFVEWENDSEDIYTLRNITKAGVELITNVVGFLKGYAYDVEITKIFDGELDLSYVFGDQIQVLT